MTLLAFDPVRLDRLRRAMSAALDDLLLVRSDDAACSEAMRSIRSTCGSFSDVWLPRINDVLHSTSMSSSTPTKLHDSTTTSAGPLWSMTDDPLPAGSQSGAPLARMYGPQRPGSRSFGEVVEAIENGRLRPLPAPLDAQGRSGAHYATLAIAPGVVREVGHADQTSGFLKFLDFWSDGLPIGWRENKQLRILYLSNARLISDTYVLEAYDRKKGPQALPGLTTEATASGYLVLHEDNSTAEVSVQIGPGVQDPTQSFPIISESSSEYTGVFYPDSPPDFQPTPGRPRLVTPPVWTFTTSASTMVDGWGRYGN